MEYDYKLGEAGTKVYRLVARATPGPNNPEDFSVSIVQRDIETGRRKELARIDNSHGKGPHIHRLYRRDELEEPFDGDLWDAVEHLEENWRTYTQSHR